MTVYFSDGFESGDLTGWSDAPWFGGGGSTAIAVATPVKFGSYAGRVRINSTANAYSGLSDNLGSTKTTLYFRGYYQLSALPGNNGDVHSIAQTQESTTANNPVAVDVYRQAVGNYKYRLVYGTNAAWNNIALSGTLTIAINTWYCLEIYYIAGAGTGEVGLYVDGIRQIQVPGLTNNNAAVQPQYVDFVAYGYGDNEAYDLFADACVAADAYIGPQAAGGVIRKFFPSTRHTNQRTSRSRAFQYR